MLRRALTTFFSWALALVILFEEWGWEPLARALAALMRLEWFARLYGRWSAWKNALIARVRASAAWREIARAKARARKIWQRLRRQTTLNSP